MHQMCVSVGLQRGFFWSVFFYWACRCFTLTKYHKPQDDWGDSQSEL